MKKNNNLEELFAGARFEVADDGFSDRVISRLSSEPMLPAFSTRGMWRKVFIRVAAVVAVSMLACASIFKGFDYDKFSSQMIYGLNVFEKKTVSITNVITSKIDPQKKSQNNETTEEQN